MLARKPLHKIGFLPFSILPWKILQAILLSSISKNEIRLAGIIENKSYNVIFNNIHWQFMTAQSTSFWFEIIFLITTFTASWIKLLHIQKGI